MEEKLIKRTLIRRKEADAKRRKLWALIVRKEIPRVCQIIWLMVFCVLGFLYFRLLTYIAEFGSCFFRLIDKSLLQGTTCFKTAKR